MKFSKLKLPKFPKWPWTSISSTNLMHNRIVLYVLVFIACINIISNALLGEYLIPSLFFLIAFITSFFNKNMVVILAIAIALSNVIRYGTRVGGNAGKEGMTDESTSSSAEKGATSEQHSQTSTNDGNIPIDASGNGATLLKRKDTTEPASKPPSSDPKPAPQTSKVDPATLKEARMHLKELTKLHDTIAQNMESMENSLKTAERIFDKVKDGFDNIQPSMAKK